jgi:hypothetical protein
VDPQAPMAVASEGAPPPVATEPAVVRPAPADDAWSSQKTVGLVVGGVGVVALGVGGIFALTAIGHNEDSKDPKLCDGNRCSLEGKATRDAAVRNGNIATGFSIGGLALAAIGTVVFLTAPSSPTRIGIAPGPNGAWLTGRFQ